MIPLLRAEWHKVARHPRLVLFTLGIFPVGSGVLLLFQWAIYFAMVEARDRLGVQDFYRDALAPWANLTAVQGALFRLLPLAFIATVFASEYTAGTWKVILPGQRRWMVLTAKAIVAGGMVWLSLAAWALIAMVGNGLPLTWLGKPYFPDWASANTQAFLLELRVEMALAAAVLAFLVVVSAWVTVQTRSTMPAVGAGVFFSMLESSAPVLLLLGNGLFGVAKDTPGFLTAWQWMPSYSVLNIREWLVRAQSYRLMDFPGGEHLPAFSLALSLLVLAGWILGFGALALATFQRQDITA